MKTLIILGVVFFSTNALAQTDSTIATIESGKIQGKLVDSVVSFKGIPYAAAPIANRRWRAPQPVKPWSGIRKALEYGNDCMQKPVGGDAAPLGTKPSEDCLKLNVWRPRTISQDKKLPVLVWIHGGGYVNGGSSPPVFDGSSFARQGLILVSFNYRLGRFGFFSHPSLVAAKEGPVGNFGLMDQIAALKWVQRNIRALGGDPRQVTLMGESAGGDSVLHLMTSPATEGLFHRAIVMSGGGRKALLGGRKLSGGTVKDPSGDRIGLNFARSEGIKSTTRLALTGLRLLPAQKIVGNVNMLGLFIRTALPIGAMKYVEGPMIDGQIVTDSPGTIFQRKQAARVPLLIGTTDADLSTRVPLTKGQVFSAFGPLSKQAQALYDPDGKAKTKALNSTAGVDLTMHEPARFVARQMTAAGNPVWLYRFGYVAQSERAKNPGAGHASEVPYAFNTVKARYGKKLTPKDEAAAQEMHTYFANFARFGDPNGKEGNLPKWSKYNPASPDLLFFTSDNGPLVKPDPWTKRLDLVEKARDAMGM